MWGPISFNLSIRGVQLANRADYSLMPPWGTGSCARICLRTWVTVAARSFVLLRDWDFPCVSNRGVLKGGRESNGSCDDNFGKRDVALIGRRVSWEFHSSVYGVKAPFRTEWRYGTMAPSWSTQTAIAAHVLSQGTGGKRTACKRISCKPFFFGRTTQQDGWMRQEEGLARALQPTYRLTNKLERSHGRCPV
ncbi:MAG: hypothetical protein RLY20_378 [Verrucomicrobiota bacterium]